MGRSGLPAVTGPLASWAMLLLATAAQACGTATCTSQVEGSPIIVAASAQSPEVVWSHPIARYDSPPDTLVLTGVMKDGRFVPGSVAVPKPSPGDAPAPDPFPLDANLLPILEARSFGLEERAKLSRVGEAVTLSCKAGEQPAGVALHAAAFRFPRAMRGDLVVEGRAVPGFAFAVVAAGADAPAPPAVGASGPTLASIPASEWNGGDAARELVINCPKEAASASISAVRIVPHEDREPADAGTWLWDARPWLDDPERLAALVRRERIANLYLQVRIEGGAVADDAGLRRLIDVLAASGVAIHAVEGDAEMATETGRAHALKRARVLRRFIEDGSGLRSIQYDIEPYLMPQHVADPFAGWTGWATTINELAEALGRTIAIVVPFWMLDDPAGKAALQMVEGAISGVTVMAYRTDLAEVESIAEAWLNWGVERRQPIAIALENGPLPVEIHQTFRRAEKGILYIDRDAREPMVRMLEAEVPASHARPTYSFSHETVAPPSRISFMDDRPALVVARERLDRTLSSWASFDGLLVHGLINPGG
ncbi:hypothetical protein [Arvimicrobium flavum]|uniref:hypothetical protein n=1 Tax=Arvimicrobium flavum TaxID=3393320 RepID=UPI00237A83ED|nr:hypothetical protein [Mesorhizobium shangrilense]